MQQDSYDKLLEAARDCVSFAWSGDTSELGIPLSLLCSLREAVEECDMFNDEEG